ncbi:MAG: trypsin-like serine protease [Myxococcota bacterium]
MLAASALLVLAGSLAVPQPAPLPVIGGDVADACEWPMTVLMAGCSGTLVHPEIVLYAAHCPNAGSIRFGTTGGERTVSTDYCAGAPEYPATGFDYAYCKLAQPVTDVPIVPIMMGCERDQLPVGTRAWLVGFGNTSNGGGGFGTKRWIEGDVAGFPAGGKQIGIFYDDPDTGICNGDSGGSAYAQLDDGSWRLFGIASTVPGSCGGSSQHIPAWAAVPWIEADAGIDITPCHDADGAWNPGPGCGSFPTNPGSDNGLSWASGCGPGPQGPVGETCGAANGQPQDLEAPAVDFLEPAAGAYPSGFDTRIELDVTDASGILDVSIAFADETQAVFEAPPYAIPSVLFPDGTWEITATARDWSANVTETSITIEVGDASADSGGAGSTGSDESSSGGAGETGIDPETSAGTSDPSGGGADTTDVETTGDGGSSSGAAASEGGESGCSCRHEPDGDAPIFAFGLLLLGLRRRR